MGNLSLPALRDSVCAISLNLTAIFVLLAVKVKGEYVVAGKGKISLNVTYPSVLEDRQIEYKVFLTNHNLPSLEEIHVDGPIQEEIEIQVNKQQDWKGASQNWPDWVCVALLSAVNRDAVGFVPKTAGTGVH